jgi:hypothetical protein
MTIQRSTRKKSGMALAVAVGCWVAAGTPATACSGPQRLNPNLGAAYLQNLALAKLAALQPPPDPEAPKEGTEPRDATAASSVSIVGLWQVNYLSGGQVVDRGYEVWHDDGTEILVDIAPPATDNVCIGVWTQTGKLNFKLTHPSWTFDINGNLTGTAMIRNTIILDSRGDKFTGTFTVDIYDNSGKLLDHLEGQLSATRIKPS